MKLFTIQIALFPQKMLDRPDKLKDEICLKMGANLFDAMPIILPPDAPAEIPIVQARSNNGRYQLNISRIRVDFIITIDYYDFNEPIDAFNAYKKYIELFYRAVTAHCDVTRVGVVFNLFEEAEENVKAIFEKYYKIDYNSKYTETNFRVNQLKTVNKMSLNNIKLVEAGVIHITQKGNREDKQGVLIQFDINNVPDSQIKLTNEKINTVLSLAVKNLDSAEIKGLI